MSVNTAAQSTTWTYVDGDWHEGNPPLIGPRSHAMWLGSTVFDNASATALGLKPTMEADAIVGLTMDGLKKFDGATAVYIRPMYWAEHGGYMGVPAEADSTRFALCLYESPMIAASGFSVGVSPFRRPTIETMPTNAKAGCLYPNNARAILDAKARGFDNALVLDMLGNVAETGTSNIFMVKDGVVFTPVPNGTFLSGITRARAIELLREAGINVVEKSLKVADFLDADEVFSTGNHSKVVPEFQAGRIAAKLRQLYMDWAQSTARV
jgi:branched-chain amino acid aminotransferase